jgi:D-amino-acid oxidase
MKTRRQIIQSAGAAACLLWMPAIARRTNAQPGGGAIKPLRSKFLLTPDLQHLRKSAEFFAGIRPHRTGGVRLSLEEISTAKGTKFLIHNYGHSGAGITLSWGCASVVRDHVETVVNQLHGTKASVAVLGSGVIGLTVATELRRKWPALPITVYAKTLNVRQTTSFIAGGQFEPSQICNEYMGDDRKVLEDYLRRSACRIKEIENSGRRLEFGVAQRKNYTLASADTAFDGCTPHDVVPLPNEGSLPFEKLNVAGREYSTWLMNPRILLPKLIVDLKTSSVRFKAKDFTDQQQVRDLNENIIINCTGYGAKKLFCDPTVQARRGLLAVLKNPAELKYFFSGGCDNDDVIAYMFARQSDLVIGGTVVRNDEREHFDHSPESTDTAECNRLIDNMQKLFDGHPSACATPPDVAGLPAVPTCPGPGT